MLDKHEFETLAAVRRNPGASQRLLADTAGASLGTTNTALKSLQKSGLVTKDNNITDAGMEALAPYKVDNAIIMAAGLSSRFAPISYERPKGVLRVRGEVLIERQIRQLQRAGITDITLVVGYKKEEFFYLGEEFDMDIVVNPDYAQRNNNSTLYLVRDRLKNTYICSSDDYFTENVFEPYVYRAYYAAEYAEGKTQEYCLQTGPHKLIKKVTHGGKNAWYMLGHAYFDRSFSEKFVQVLESVYDDPETADLLWEDIYAQHISELPMYMRKYNPGVIYEFDSLEELRSFDPDFVENVDSQIFDNISKVLHCERTQILDVVAIKKGLTNMSFKFTVDGTDYVYRHPGARTSEIIDRASETYSQQIARDLGIDDTFICEDPEEGWKIARYIKNCKPFDYHNEDHVKAAMQIARTLHTSGKHSEFAFDIYAKAEGIIKILKPTNRLDFADFNKLYAKIQRVHQHVLEDKVEPCLCHNDFYDPNFLVSKNGIRLIDWEYSGESDYASDLGTFICCSDYSYKEAKHVFEEYFQRKPTDAELAHCVAYVSLSSFYWFVWAILQDYNGKTTGEYLYHWYKYAKTYAKKALKLYEGEED